MFRLSFFLVVGGSVLLVGLAVFLTVFSGGPAGVADLVLDTAGGARRCFDFSSTLFLMLRFHP